MKQILFVLAFCSGFSVFAEESDIFTNVYVVPPTFLNTQAERRPTAREVLFDAGIDFPEGTSAIYNPATSQLIVRTTQDRMALVEGYIESITQQVEKQIYLTIRELEFAEKPFELAEKSELFGNFVNPEGLPEVDIRKRSRVFEQRSSFLQTLSHPPRTDFPATTAAKRGMIGVFTDPQFQVMIRAISESLHLKEIPTASVMARSGQHALVQEAAKRWGVVPVIGADGFTIDLEYYFPAPGEAFFPDGPGSRDPERVTIWDGQTVAWAEEKKDGSWRIVFLTAQLMDPDGMPVNSAEKRNAPVNEDRVELPKATSESKEEAGLSPRDEALVKLADEAASRGSDLLAEGDLDSARKYYELSLAFLPEVEMTEPRREAYRKQLERTQSEP